VGATTAQQKGDDRMNRLPNTPDEASAIEPGTMTVAAFHEALREIEPFDKSGKKRRAMARLIATHGRKYTPDARRFAREYAETIE